MLFVFLLLISLELKAQNSFKGLEVLFSTPKNYVVQHTDDVLKMDGNLEESDWQKTAWTEDFVDIEGAKKPLPKLQTQVKMLWNDSTLFIAAKLQEPQLWATQTHHDDIIYKDNDFEVFIDPDNNTHQYFEIEINQFNKIFDLFMPKPYRNGGNALIGWDVEGLQTGVKLDGTLNQPQDEDKSWTVEMAIPLKSLRMGFSLIKPKEGTLWRINFSRVEWDTKISNGKNEKLKNAAGKDLPEHNWVWSPQGVINMHYPERWGYLQFSRKADAVFTLSFSELQKQYLWLVYYRQKQYLQKNGKYAATLAELHLEPIAKIGERESLLQMDASGRQFTATVKAEGSVAISINDEGLIETIKTKP
ncbi:MAG: carbohydrate-binding family 9-like protein [Mucilaginibacter sp.]|uniref:carbohydrate-binding family 9-like protein n=1 Tax=Mucilaginibacter sp. TaxID=1882438 RepID=UPI0034E52EC7